MRPDSDRKCRHCQEVDIFIDDEPAHAVVAVDAQSLAHGGLVRVAARGDDPIAHLHLDLVLQQAKRVHHQDGVDNRVSCLALNGCHTTSLQ